MMGWPWVAVWALFGVAGEVIATPEAGVTLVIHSPFRDERLSLQRGYDCFGDRTVRLELDVLGRVGSSVDLIGQLFQLTTSLAVPTGEPIEIVVAKRFGDTARFRVSVPVHLPTVKRPSRFDFRIRGRSVAKSAWRSVGHQDFEVHPRSVMSELAHLGKTRLFILNDHGRGLTSFFEDEEIPFSVLTGAALSELPLVRVADRTASAAIYTEDRLVLSVVSSETEIRRVRASDPILDDLLRKGFRVIQFREKVGTVPVVFVRQVASGVRVDVQMPLIDALADSPRAQLFLLELIRLALDDARP